MLRNPDTIPAGDVIIEDPVMEPFFITKSSSGGYTVYERVVRGDSDKEYLRTVSYPATFNYALKTVSKELLHSQNNTKHYSTVREYIQNWEAIEKKMAEMTSLM